MRRLLVIALSLMLPLCACAQKKGFKLVEKSGPKPEWVGQGSVKDYIIVQSDKPKRQSPTPCRKCAPK